jgi:hypothetical protein
VGEGSLFPPCELIDNLWRNLDDCEEWSFF